MVMTFRESHCLNDHTDTKNRCIIVYSRFEKFVDLPSVLELMISSAPRAFSSSTWSSRRTTLMVLILQYLQIWITCLQPTIPSLVGFINAIDKVHEGYIPRSNFSELEGQILELSFTSIGLFLRSWSPKILHWLICIHNRVPFHLGCMLGGSVWSWMKKSTLFSVH